MIVSVRRGCRCLGRVAAVLALSFANAFGDGGKEWQAILQLERGPGREAASREEAGAVTVAHLKKQEQALRQFIRTRSSHPQALDAQLRLAHLLGTQNDFGANPNGFRDAHRLLSQIRNAGGLPPEREADVAFAQVALTMRQKRNPGKQDREILLAGARAFQRQFPNDRRVAALLVEVATAFDSDPSGKRALLADALRHTRDPELRARIDDDFRRLDLLGKPLTLSVASTRGEAIDLEKLRGRTVLLYFFAASSPPAVVGLAEVRRLRAAFSAGDLQIIGISVDARVADTEELLRREKIDWPVYCSGRGWDDPDIRRWGINAIPALWLLDRQGRLRSIDARQDTEPLIRQLLREK